MPTKQTTSRDAAKKSSTKKRATSTVTKSKGVPLSLCFASDETSFWVADGQILNSLTALGDALAEMEKATFSHHVTNDKNDFAEWVEIVLQDKDCAELLRKAKTMSAAKTAVSKSLKKYAL